MNFKLPHDVVCTCAKRMKTAEQTVPLGLLAINVLFPHGILMAFVGPSARHFCLLSVFCGLIFVSIRVIRGSS